VTAGPAVSPYFQMVTVIVIAILVGINSLTLMCAPIKKILCPRFGDSGKSKCVNH
jgi:hypothetical protein